MTAILSLEDDDGLRCVDINLAGSGTFTFKEFRKDVEDPGRWYLVRDYSDKSFNSKDDAIAAAAASTSWLREKLGRGNRCGSQRKPLPALDASRTHGLRAAGSSTNKNPAICGGVRSGRKSRTGSTLDQAGIRSSCSCGSRST
jgi:hypothetical protein